MRDFFEGMGRFCLVGLTLAGSLVGVGSLPDDGFAATAAVSGEKSLYTFNTDGTLQEAGSMSQSSSPYWWLNSGGQLIIASHVGQTIQGSLLLNALWRLRYLLSNPLDTDNGYYPQNVFRLVSKSVWKNLDQSILVKVNDLNMTDTPNRGAFSGILLMSRYQDGNTLYYAGIRMDGYAVIKKKYLGKYYTLAYKKVFGFDKTYNYETEPNLIPEKQWLGLRSITRTNSDGSVTIQLLLDKNSTGAWETILSAVDKGAGGVPAINNPGYAGLRTDYFDMSFDNYSFLEL